MITLDYFPALQGVRALTLRNPWPWATAHAGKTPENRTQPYSYRGPLLIHAGKDWDEVDVDDERIAGARFTSRPANVEGYTVVGCRWCDVELCLANDGLAFASWRRYHECDRSKVATSAVVAVSFLVDCHTSGGCCAPWGESCYVEAGGGRRRMNVHHLVLEDTWALPEPIECSGQQGLWRPGPDVVEAVAEQLLVEQRRLDVAAGAQACTNCGCTDRWGCLERCSWAHGPFDDPLCSSCT